MLFSLETLKVSPTYHAIITSAHDPGSMVQWSATLKTWVTRAKNSQHTWQMTISSRIATLTQSFLSYRELKSWNMYLLIQSLENSKEINNCKR